MAGTASSQSGSRTQSIQTSIKSRRSKSTSSELSTAKSSKKPPLNPQRRQSPRLKRINAICDSECMTMSAKRHFDENKEHIPSDQTKVEIALHEDCGKDVNFSKSCPKDESNSSDSEDVECITLRDFRVRCRNKTRKVGKSVPFLQADGKNQLPEVKIPKEEEPDLDEPLSAFKLRRPKLSRSEKKRRKVEHSFSESSVSLESSVYADTGEGMSPTGYVGLKSGLILKQEFCDANVITSTSSSSPPLEMKSKNQILKVDSPQSILKVKNEIMESDMDNCNPSCTVSFIQKGYFTGESSSLLYMKCKSNEEELSNPTDRFLHDWSTDVLDDAKGDFSASICEFNRDVNVDNHELGNDVCEILDSDLPVHETNMYSNTTTAGQDCGTPKADNGELFCSVNEMLYCQLNEASTEYREPEGDTCIPRSNEDAEGTATIGDLELSSPRDAEFFTPTFSYGWNTVFGGTDKVESVEPAVDSNRIQLVDHSVTSNSFENNEGVDISHLSGSNFICEDISDSDCVLPNSDVPLRSAPSVVAINHESFSDERNGFVDEPILGYNATENNVSCDTYTEVCCSVETNDDRFPRNCYISDAVDEISPETGKYTSMQQISNDETEAGSLITEERLKETLDVYSFQSCSSCNMVTNGLQSMDQTDYSLSYGEMPSSAQLEDPLVYPAKVPGRTLTSFSDMIYPERTYASQEIKLEKEWKDADFPRRLLSKRKSMSPSSQEKLCNALSGMELYDAIQNSKNRKRLLYRNWSEDGNALSTAGCNRMETSIESERMNKKTKNNSVGKGILKSPDAVSSLKSLPETSSKQGCSCMKNSLMHKQTEDAIAFSQRQMHDFESIAAKLLKGLKSMKNIVEEALLLEPTSYSTPNITPDKTKEVLSNASELETTTKKWLSILARDCTRVCKIMRTRASEAATLDDGVQKQGKKISFADETGAPLYHIKFFEEEQA